MTFFFIHFPGEKDLILTLTSFQGCENECVANESMWN